MPSVAKQWAVTTNGTFDFNDPANWQFGIVPGILDAAAFNTNVNDTVTGNATIHRGAADRPGAHYADRLLHAVGGAADRALDRR